MRFLLTFSCLLLIVFSSCRKDFDTVVNKGNLTFSRDTVLLNRVFSEISSSTRQFKVYNSSNDDITIPRITLGKGESSFYRLNVDGIPGKDFENINILARDSIFIFVEATIDFSKVSDADFFYRDEVVFYSENDEQRVHLEALVLDVNLIRPDRTQNPDGGFDYETIVLGKDSNGETIRIKGTMLTGNTTFTNDKPYLIYGYVGVPENGTLTLEEGTTLYFHNNSGIIVNKNARLIGNGTLDAPVLLEDDRLEPEFEDAPGQWGTVWIRAGSQGNRLHYTTIKNSGLGILVDSMYNGQPTLTLKNTRIYNSAGFGLLGRYAHIIGENVVIGNSGQSSFAGTQGGKYVFTHSTFANYFSGGFRQFPAVLLNNFLRVTDGSNNEITVAYPLSSANFTNSIIDGNQSVELLLEKVDEADFNYNFSHTAIKFDTDNNSLLNNPLYDFDNADHYKNIILNPNLDFRDDTVNDFIIGETSEVINLADKNAALTVPLDILGVDRTTSPDMGAYQHIVFEEEE